jgi:hypothetical protein
MRVSCSRWLGSGIVGRTQAATQWRPARSLARMFARAAEPPLKACSGTFGRPSHRTMVSFFAMKPQSCRWLKSSDPLRRFLVVFRAECAIVWSRVEIKGVQDESDHIGVYLQQEIGSLSQSGLGAHYKPGALQLDVNLLTAEFPAALAAALGRARVRTKRIATSLPASETEATAGTVAEAS